VNGLIAFIKREINANPKSLTSESKPNQPRSLAERLAPGLVIQVLSQTMEHHGNQQEMEVVRNLARQILPTLQKNADPLAIAATVQGLCQCLRISADSELQTMALSLSDELCNFQYQPTNTHVRTWTGGFRLTGGTEPGWESALIAAAIADATRLTRTIPDLTRYQKYRHATVLGLQFVTSNQFTADPAGLDPGFHARFLHGGVRNSPSNPAVGIDATSAFVLGLLRYLQSGGDQRLE
jgi:hypothetical protein